MLKALLRSKNAAKLICFLSMAHLHLSVRVSRAVVHEDFFLKANCSLLIRLCSKAKVCNWLFSNFSMSLERQGKTDIGRKLSHKVLSLPLGKAVTFAVFQNVGNTPHWKDWLNK